MVELNSRSFSKCKIFYLTFCKLMLFSMHPMKCTTENAKVWLDGATFWFWLSPRNFNPRKFNFWSVFHTKPFPPVTPCDDNGIKRCEILLCTFWYIGKVCHIMSTYLNAHAKVKKCIFDSQLPGNWFEFGIIENDLWSSTIWAIQIKNSFAEFKNPRIPVMQPMNVLL